MLSPGSMARNYLESKAHVVSVVGRGGDRGRGREDSGVIGPVCCYYCKNNIINAGQTLNMTLVMFG